MIGGWALSAVCGWSFAAAALIAARAARVRRAELVAVACHELRGPLSAMALGLELAARTGGLAPARVRALELELHRATQAVDDLAVAGVGIAAPNADPSSGEDVAVGSLLVDSVEAWRPVAAGRELRLELGRLTDTTVRGSRVRLAQVTGNLIANAIEHGSGTIRVSARCSERAVRIEVQDDGPGLPAPLACLLRRRSRFAWPLARDGRGHGLRIVDHVARAHGGRLELAPSAAGARLIVELPLAAVTAAASVNRAPI